MSAHLNNSQHGSEMGKGLNLLWTALYLNCLHVSQTLLYCFIVCMCVLLILLEFMKTLTLMEATLEAENEVSTLTCKCSTLDWYKATSAP